MVIRFSSPSLCHPDTYVKFLIHGFDAFWYFNVLLGRHTCFWHSRLPFFVGELLLLACVILVGLFALQHFGTRNVAFMFAPIVMIWLVSILSIGLYNIIYWNPKIVCAISPHYIITYFKVCGKDGWISLGGILLCITGRLHLV